MNKMLKNRFLLTTPVPLILFYVRVEGTIASDEREGLIRSRVTRVFLSGFFRAVDFRWDAELALQLPGTRDDQSINPTKEAA